MFLILVIVYVAGLMVSLVIAGYHWDDDESDVLGMGLASAFWPIIVAIAVPVFVIVGIFIGPMWLGRAIKNRRAGQRRA